MRLNKLDNTLLYYVASPYTAPTTISKREQHRMMVKRYQDITRLGAKLILDYDLDLVLPITTSKVLREFEPALGTRWDYWAKTDTNLVKHCDALIVVQMDGWKESVGVQAEIDVAKLENKLIYYLDPVTIHVRRETY